MPILPVCSCMTNASNGSSQTIGWELVECFFSSLLIVESCLSKCNSPSSWLLPADDGRLGGCSGTFSFAPVGFKDIHSKTNCFKVWSTSKLSHWWNREEKEKVFKINLREEVRHWYRIGEIDSNVLDVLSCRHRPVFFLLIQEDEPIENETWGNPVRFSVDPKWLDDLMLSIVVLSHHHSRPSSVLIPLLWKTELSERVFPFPNEREEWSFFNS